MPIYEFAPDRIQPLSKTTFSAMQLQERRDLQRLLRAKISVIAPDTLVIAEEFGAWDESRRRIDLLGIDRDANLVVIELKRTEDGGHMELQTIRYAAMVSTMTFDQAADVFARYLGQIGKAEADARGELLDFLGWDQPDEDAFGQDVRIVLGSAEFSRELTTSVLWLIEHGIDIRCVRLQPYSLDGRTLVDVQQIIPLPEVAEYQVRVTEKKRKEREARTDTRDWTSYDVTLEGRQMKGLRKRHAIYQTFRHLVEAASLPRKLRSIAVRGPTEPSCRSRAGSMPRTSVASRRRRGKRKGAALTQRDTSVAKKRSSISEAAHMHSLINGAAQRGCRQWSACGTLFLTKGSCSPRLNSDRFQLAMEADKSLMVPDPVLETTTCPRPTTPR